MISLPGSDDLAQETAIAEWQAEQSYDGRCPLGAWKAIKARSARMDYARRWMETRKRTGCCAEMPAQIGNEQPVVYEPRLVREIAELSEEYQRILYMRYWEGYTPTQIGKILGMNTGLVDGKLTLIKRRLRRGIILKK